VKNGKIIWGGIKMAGSNLFPAQAGKGKALHNGIEQRAKGWGVTLH
jgi:hypothetical protein